MPDNIVSKQIYGICGLKGHGKDTFANLIISSNDNFKLYHFADSLKNMSAKIFGLSQEEMYNPKRKEEPFSQPIFMDEFVDQMSKETGLKIQKANCIASSPRELMQYIGTEYIRKIDEHYWTNYLFDKLSNEDNYLISDLRFPNEADTITSKGGKIIKIIRVDAEDNSDYHASELSLNDIVPDITIGTVTGDLSLAVKAANLISSGNFEAAKIYDYNHIKMLLKYSKENFISISDYYKKEI